MAGLPRKYAKMGFKKGWKAFLKTKKRKTKTSRTVYKMARRRKRGFFKKAYRKVKSGLTFGNITKVFIGAGLAALYEVFVSPMIPIDGLVKNLLELAMGVFLMVGRFPMPIKAFGAALATINAYGLIMAYMPGLGNTSTGSEW